MLLQIGSTDFAKIIEAEAKSQLGIISLIILAISVIGYLFFRNEGVKIKVPIFVLLVGSFIGFFVAINNANPGGGTSATPTPSTSPSPSMLKDSNTKCIDDATDELVKNPNNASALYDRADCYQNRKSADDIPRAIADYTKVIDLDKAAGTERADVFQNRGNAYEAGNEVAKAVEDYSSALRLVGSGKAGSANKYDVLKDRGYAYSRDGKRNLMLADFKAICAESPNSDQCNEVKADIQ